MSFSCDQQCQEDLLRYVVIYWVLLLPLWVAGAVLMLSLYLVGLSYRRWPVAVGGSLIGAVAALTTYGLWVAAMSTREIVNGKVGVRAPSTGFVSV